MEYQVLYNIYSKYAKYVNDPSVFFNVKKIRNAVIAGLILLAGLKSSEVINMKCIDVDPVDRVIYTVKEITYSRNT